MMDVIDNIDAKISELEEQVEQLRQKKSGLLQVSDKEYELLYMLLKKAHVMVENEEGLAPLPEIHWPSHNDAVAIFSPYKKYSGWLPHIAHLLHDAIRQTPRDEKISYIRLHVERMKMGKEKDNE
jgi:hypothetical protein